MALIDKIVALSTYAQSLRDDFEESSDPSKAEVREEIRAYKKLCDLTDKLAEQLNLTNPKKVDRLVVQEGEEFQEGLGNYFKSNQSDLELSVEEASFVKGKLFLKIKPKRKRKRSKALVV